MHGSPIAAVFNDEAQHLFPPEGHVVLLHVAQVPHVHLLSGIVLPGVASKSGVLQVPGRAAALVVPVDHVRISPCGLGLVVEDVHLQARGGRGRMTTTVSGLPSILHSFLPLLLLLVGLLHQSCAALPCRPRPSILRGSVILPPPRPPRPPPQILRPSSLSPSSSLARLELADRAVVLLAVRAVGGGRGRALALAVRICAFIVRGAELHPFLVSATPPGAGPLPTAGASDAALAPARRQLLR
eukprot:6459419-Pyramimonas_sp.AAC.2